MGTENKATAKTQTNTGGMSAADWAKLVKIAQSRTSANASTASAAVFTKQEADYVVQSMYQQLLGRNATGNDYSKAINLILSQSSDTSSAARGQALSNQIMQSPEYKIKQENKYLDSIYNAVAADVRKAQV